jgi:TPR repeat protein
MKCGLYGDEEKKPSIDLLFSDSKEAESHPDKMIQIYFKEIEPGHPKIVLFLKDFPIDKEITYSMERPLKTAQGITTKLKDPNIIFFSSRGFLPGERVNCSFSSKGDFEVKTSFIPNPIKASNKNGTVSIEAELITCFPAYYQFFFKGFEDNEEIKLISVSGKEKIKKTFKITPENLIALSPDILGKEGGVSQETFIRKSGEKIQFNLPWGMDLVSYAKGEKIYHPDSGSYSEISQLIDEKMSAEKKDSPYLKRAFKLISKHQVKDLILYLNRDEVQKDSGIQELMGSLYHEGQIVEKDYTKAALWWEKAAFQGDAKAQSHLADLYFCGRGVEKNNEKGMIWLNKSLAQNDSTAQHILGQKYHLGDGVPQDYRKAFELYEKSALQDNAYGKYGLGMLYLKGLGTEQNYLEAFRLIKMAADKDVKEAQFDLGVMYFDGEGVKQDAALGITYIELSANQGFDLAQCALGIIYGDHGQKDKARKWFQKAAAQGNKNAEIELQKLLSPNQ